MQISLKISIVGCVQNPIDPARVFSLLPSAPASGENIDMGFFGKIFPFKFSILQAEPYLCLPENIPGIKSKVHGES